MDKRDGMNYAPVGRPDPVVKPVAEWVAKPVAETIADAIDEPEDRQETPVDFSILETPTGEEPPENKMGE